MTRWRRYGTDKPDLRNPLVMHDVIGGVRRLEFPRLQAHRRKRRCWSARSRRPDRHGGRALLSGPDGCLGEIGEGSPGLGYIILDGSDQELAGRGPIASNLGAENSPRSPALAGVGAAMRCFLPPARRPKRNGFAGAARTRDRRRDLGLIEEGAFRFCWVVDFPMYERSEETGQIEFSHNPFSMPQGGLEALETQDPLTILAHQYDIVCNGVELSSGAIRNHRPDIMYKAFAIAGYTAAEVEARFGGMLNAFRYGAPPHGGSAPGIDRIVMLLADTPNIREIVVFPMNQQARDLMMRAPAPVPPERLKELHIRLDLPPPKPATRKRWLIHLRRPRVGLLAWCANGAMALARSLMFVGRVDSVESIVRL